MTPVFIAELSSVEFSCRPQGRNYSESSRGHTEEVRCCVVSLPGTCPEELRGSLLPFLLALRGQMWDGISPHRILSYVFLNKNIHLVFSLQRITVLSRHESLMPINWKENLFVLKYFLLSK